MSEHSIEHIDQMIKNYSLDELRQLRDHIERRIFDLTPGEQPGTTGPDSSADSEKKKAIAQSSQPIQQETAQSVPEPESDEVKDLQNQEARAEHDAKASQ